MESVKRHWSGWRRFGRLRSWMLLVPGVLLAGGLWLSRAHAFGGPGFGPPPFMAGSPEEHRTRMEKRLEAALKAIDATDAQRATIKAIFGRLHAELAPIHQDQVRLHDEMKSVLSAPAVDPAEVEKLRVASTALMDRASKAFTQALVEAAGVLTPEQRKAMLERLEQHRGFRHRGL